jgi:hypothetical protein
MCGEAAIARTDRPFHLSAPERFAPQGPAWFTAEFSWAVALEDVNRTAGDKRVHFLVRQAWRCRLGQSLFLSV